MLHAIHSAFAAAAAIAVGAIAPAPHAEAQQRNMVIFGDSVPPATRTRDRGLVADFADRLQRATGHPVGLTGDNGNFVVMIVNEDERRSIGPRLAAAITERWDRLDLLVLNAAMLGTLAATNAIDAKGRELV